MARGYPSIPKAKAFPKWPVPTKQISMHLSLAQSMSCDLLASKKTGYRCLEFLVSARVRPAKEKGWERWLISRHPVCPASSLPISALHFSLSRPFFCFTIYMVQDDHLCSRDPPSPEACFSICNPHLSALDSLVRSQSSQSCQTVHDPMDGNIPGSSIHGISQQDYWNGLPFPLPGDLLDPEDQTCASCIGRQILYHLSLLGSPRFTGDTC